MAIVEVCLKEIFGLSSNLWPDVLEALVERSVPVAVIQVCEGKISYENRFIGSIFDLHGYSEYPNGFFYERPIFVYQHHFEWSQFPFQL